jgi:hypothetical protein
VHKNPYNNRWSIPSIMRHARFRSVNSVIAEIIKEKGSCRILDVGGEDQYWNLNEAFINENRAKLKIILMNLDQAKHGRQYDLYEYRYGDATTDVSYRNNDFDMIHSNSVIEHVGSWPSICNMANLIQNSKKPYYLQTPNFWFPFEPHFRFIGFQWLPKAWQASLLVKFSLGFFGKCKTYGEAMYNVDSINLLTANQMRELFPKAKIVKERLFGLTKSFIVLG